MNIDIVNRIKRIAIIALASDDKLVETLVLKSGNAIDLAYRPSSEKVSRCDLLHKMFNPVRSNKLIAKLCVISYLT